MPKAPASSGERPVYDCDTSPYWASEEDYRNATRTFGRFVEDGEAYEIFDRHTPRPWLNYLCNDRFGSVVSNTGLGFTWYRTTLVRITKYEHAIDYLPRDFEDGREVLLRDTESGAEWEAFRDAENVLCRHRPGSSTLSAETHGIEVEMTVFVPRDDMAECWLITLKNLRESPAHIHVRLGQTWCFAKFGVHTAEEGIPYVSTPGQDLETAARGNAAIAHSTNPDLPVELSAVFFSPQAQVAHVTDQTETRNDGRVFTFKRCDLQLDVAMAPGEEQVIDVLSGADEEETFPATMSKKYASHDVFMSERGKVDAAWRDLIDCPSCNIPDADVQNFLNVWLKNQLFLTFRFIRSGYVGYRDTLQDTWGYTLIEPGKARAQLLRTLSHMMTDGSCPRGYAPFNDKADCRRFMDSGTWIPMTLCDYIKETGDVAILEECIPYLDDPRKESVSQHVWNAMNLLFENRGQHDLCLVGDGDWNDALEGISRSGAAESAWLTIALYNAQNIMADLYRHVGDEPKARELLARSDTLKQAMNASAWDGDWFVYGFTGSGNPIGSATCREGKIHLNAQTWAIFSGLATPEQTEHMRGAIAQHLDTEVGPALLAPPYVDEADEVGRIANLEPGTFENGSVYQHAVAFKIFADLRSGHAEDAFEALTRLLPTNPRNPDCRRTSEPYCMGNYYCGPGHARFGQNFFTWFTGTPAWLLRIGFDELLGVKAEFDGLALNPSVPAAWDNFSVKRRCRGCVYTVEFRRAGADERRRVVVDGKEQTEPLVPYREGPVCQIDCWF